MGNAKDQLTAVKDLVTNGLLAHGLSWKSEKMPRAEWVLFQSASRADRVRVMGDPVRYVEVMFQQEGEDSDDAFLASGAKERAARMFSVDVFFEYEDADDVEEHSYTKWMDIMESADLTVPGLLWLLRRTKFIDGIYLTDDTGDYVTQTAPADMTTQSGVLMFTQSGVGMTTQESGSEENILINPSDLGYLADPSPDALLNAILPLGDGTERAHVCSFTIELTL